MSRDGKCIYLACCWIPNEMCRGVLNDACRDEKNDDTVSSVTGRGKGREYPLCNAHMVTRNNSLVSEESVC